MAAILVDVDGVLHVSGAPIAGAALAVKRLRDAGHRLRFVTNSTTRSRAQLVEQLCAMGIELDADELQTTGSVAASALAGKRVLALTMPGILDDLDGLQLVGMNVDAVLIGGADEGEETGRVFSYLNLNRAFHELEAGADLVLPAQEQVVADRRRRPAGRRRVRRRAGVRRRHRGDRARQAQLGVLRSRARALSTPSPD